jgi:DNA-binding NtrC family response regulator
LKTTPPIPLRELRLIVSDADPEGLLRLEAELRGADPEALGRAIRSALEGLVGGPRQADPAPDLDLSLRGWLDRCEKSYLEALLRSRRGRVQEAASAAEVNRRTMLRKLNKHGLEKRDYR